MQDFTSVLLGIKMKIKNLKRSLSSPTSQASCFFKFSDKYKTEIPYANIAYENELVEVKRLDTFVKNYYADKKILLFI